MLRSRLDQAACPPWLAWLMTATAVVLAQPAAAAQVYHSASDDGVVGATEIPAGAQSVFLYINGGAVASQAAARCHDGLGDEVCGFDLTLTAKNGLSFSSFVADPGADLLTNLAAGELRINGLDTNTPTPGAQRIGELLVNAAIGGEIELTSGEVIGADLESELLGPTQLVTVPEPAAWFGLACGATLLVWLRRRREGARIVSALTLTLFAFATLGAGGADAAPLILNEFNAVSGSGFLNGGTASTDGDGNSTNPPADPYFGRIAGNGGDWIELAVVGDHLDIRGWSIVICALGACAHQLFFSNDVVWSDLPAGAIITVAEDEPTDLSLDPGAGDWWMNVRAHNGGNGTYITASNFPVSQNDWQMTILDDASQVVFGPIGEHVPQDPVAGCFPPQDDVNSGEIFRLEQAPSALIDPCHVTLNDYEDGVLSTFGQENEWNSGLAVQDFTNLRTLVPHPDRDGDQIPDDGDFSGIAGDSPCIGGATAGCDDNCAGLQNAAQADTGGPGGADGMGDGCQCGDPTGDDDATAADILEIRELHVGLRSELTVPERCSVHSDGQCTLTDLVVLDRTIGDPASAPGLAPSCQAAGVPTDQTEFMFDPERLLEVDVRIQKTDWDLLRVEELDVIGEIFSPTCGNQPWRDIFDYTFYPADVTVDGYAIDNVAVRKKGFFGSLSTTMPSLKIKFDEYVGGQQLNDMDRMTLNNNQQDPAHVKQCLGYKLMREAGVPAPRCNFAHLTVTVLDGMAETVEVDRIYTHVESIKDPFLRRHFGSDAGRLYEGTLSDFWLGSYRNTIEPKSLLAAADTTEIDALVTALMDGGLTNPQRLAAIEGLVDIDSFLTFWAAEGMIGHWDGYADNQNNFWFYIDPADGLIHFIPWGTDDTFGRGNEFRGGDDTHAAAIVPRSALPRRLYEIASTKSQFLAKLATLMNTVYDEAAIHAEIDRIEALITPVAGNLTTDLAFIRTWVDAHRASVAAEIASPPTGFGGQAGHFCVLNP